MGGDGFSIDLEEGRDISISKLNQIELGKNNETELVVDTTRTEYALPADGFSQKDEKGNPTSQSYWLYLIHRG